MSQKYKHLELKEENFCKIQNKQPGGGVNGGHSNGTGRALVIRKKKN